MKIRVQEMQFQLLFAFSFFILSFSKGQAQISLNENDLGNAGDVVPMSIVNYTLGPPATGQNMTWDFSNLVKGLGDSIKYFLPSQVSGGASFPNSNFALKDNLTDYFMRKIPAGSANAGLQLNGFGISGLASLPINGLPPIGPFRLNPSLKVMPFPAVYKPTEVTATGTTRFTFAFDTTVNVNGTNVNIDSVRISPTIRLISSFPGEGTIALPGGSENVLMEKVNQRISFSIAVGTQTFLGFIYLPFPLGLPNIISNTYRFWAKGKKAPVCEFVFDSAQTTVQNARVQDYLLTSAKASIAGTEEQVKIFPNPAKEYIQLLAPEGKQYTISIFSSNGKMMLQKNMTSASQISTSAFPRGLYYIRFEDDSKRMIQNKKLFLE